MQTQLSSETQPSSKTQPSPAPQARWLSPLLLAISVRYLLRHPLQFGLCVLGVALGVAVVVSIDLANASASRAFQISTETIAGAATHQIVAGPSGLDEDLYRRIRTELGIRTTAPIVEGYLASPALPGTTLQLIGVDLFAEAPFRPYLSAPLGAPADGADDDSTADLTLLLTQPDSIVMAASTAQQAGIAAGDRLPLTIGSQQREVQVIGLLQSGDDLGQQARANLLIADIATAQELLGSVGRLTRIDLILPEPADAALAELAAILPPGAEITVPQARTNALRQMTRAFELNLAALSLLALVVGMFLIYNTMTFSVVQRREMLGTLRCLGITRNQILSLVLLEALLMSLLGSAIGLLLGTLLGRGLVQLVARTINDLYFTINVTGLAIDPLVLLKGLLLGVGATLVAATVPAREAMLAAPRTVQRRSTAEEQVRRALPYVTGAGVLALIAGAVILLVAEEGVWQQIGNDWIATVPGISIVSAFAALFLIVIGCALLTPILTVLLMQGLRPLMGRVFGLTGRMAARSVVVTLSRTAVAVAALMVAVSVTIGVGTMVGSFRQTVIAWLEETLVADIYIAPPSNIATRSDGTIPPATIERLVQTPGVEGWVLFRNILLDLPSGPTTLVVIDRSHTTRENPPEFRSSIPNAIAAYDAGAILISEPLAYRLQLDAGDTLELRTERGWHAFPIAGVYYDYASDRGVIRMDAATYRTWFDDPLISSMAIYAAPGVSVDALVDALEVAVPAEERLLINSNRGLKAGTLEVFDRTFAITSVLQLLATIVAFIGILSALLALQLERGRELGMLRATGMTPRQIWRLVLTETGLVGLAAGVLAMPVGLLVALLLIFVINRRSFGWTLNFQFDPALLLQAVLLALVAALLAGVYPAWRMGRISPAVALREE